MPQVKSSRYSRSFSSASTSMFFSFWFSPRISTRRRGMFRRKVISVRLLCPRSSASRFVQYFRSSNSLLAWFGHFPWSVEKASASVRTMCRVLYFMSCSFQPNSTSGSASVSLPTWAAVTWVANMSTFFRFGNSFRKAMKSSMEETVSSPMSIYVASRLKETLPKATVSLVSSAAATPHRSRHTSSRAVIFLMRQLLSPRGQFT